MPSEPRTTRLAPSPTGALHLGNARTFLVNWALARREGWRIVLRIEDLDGPRIKSGADTQAMADLRWLGMDWDPWPAGAGVGADGHGTPPPLYQRADLAPYRRALELLHQRGLIYPCRCTRTDIERAQAAPHGDEHELRYPGTCRPGTDAEFRVSGFEFRVEDGKAGARDLNSQPETRNPKLDCPAWRLIVPDETIEFTDMVAGRQAFNVQEQVGDFIVATKAGLPAYQLAVVVDDARQGVTDVVRGDDLLRSTARQVLLYRALGLGSPLPSGGEGGRLPGRPGEGLLSGEPGISHQEPAIPDPHPSPLPQKGEGTGWSAELPRYWHLPLVLGADGRRLAKRHGDTRVAWYRDQGVRPQRVIGLLAYWCGLVDRPAPMEAAEFRDRFDLARLPRMPVTFRTEDHAWLLGR